MNLTVSGREPARSLRSLHGCRAWLAGSSAKAAAHAVEISDRGMKIGGVEVRPHGIRKQKLGIGGSHSRKSERQFLAAGADEQIHVAALCGKGLRQHAAQHVGRRRLIWRERIGRTARRA